MNANIHRPKKYNTRPDYNQRLTTSQERVSNSKKNHPLGNIKVKTLYKIETKEKPTEQNIEEEKLGEQDFPPQYSEIKEGKIDLDETKAP